MNVTTLLHRAARCTVIAASLVLPCSLAQAADDPLPEVSEDGLHLQKSKNARVVYVRPGATLAAYKRVAILECEVAFEKDWQRKYNQEQYSLSARVTDQDAAEIKTALAAEFMKIFTDELQNKGGYQITDIMAPDVLVLRPALVNLKITAPDVNSSGMARTVVNSAGQMTLFLELYDAVSKQLLARVIDPKADPDSYAKQANRVTNRAAVDRMLRDWARKLREHLDAVHGPQAAAPDKS